MKKYPGLKQFVNSDLNRYDSKVVSKVRGQPAVTFYDEVGAIIRKVPLEKASAAQIKQHLADMGIHPR